MTGHMSRQAGRLYEVPCLLAAVMLVLAIVIPSLLGAKPTHPGDVAPETTATTTSGS